MFGIEAVTTGVFQQLEAIEKIHGSNETHNVLSTYYTSLIPEGRSPSRFS